MILTNTQLDNHNSETPKGAWTFRVLFEASIWIKYITLLIVRLSVTFPVAMVLIFGLRLLIMPFIFQTIL